jgi:cytosine/creatinine deaminase
MIAGGPKPVAPFSHAVETDGFVFVTGQMPDILLNNVTLWGTEGVRNVSVANGRFVRIDEGPSPLLSTVTLDAEGRMAVPGFIEPHIHLDKALISERAPVNVSGTLRRRSKFSGRSSATTRPRKSPTARHACSRALENGISRLRTHVYVDPIGGTRPAEGLSALAIDFGT